MRSAKPGGIPFDRRSNAAKPISQSEISQAPRPAIAQAPTRRISEIRIGARHRRDLGDIDSLAASIGEVGLLHPVVITPGNVLIAGERRLAACKALGWTDVPVTVVDLDGIVRGEFAENAIRKNFVPSEIDAIRRTLEPFERAAAKARMSDGAKGSEIFATLPGKTSDKIGAFAGVSGRTVEKIAAVVEAAKTDPKAYGHLVGEMDDHGVDRAYRALRRDERFRKIAEISNADAPLPQDRKYPVLYADPAWRFEVYDRATGLDAAADAHYPTMTTDEIKALAIPAADDAVLLLWATAPMLPQALEVMEAWGFKYVSNLVWPKDRAGTGYWVRNKHEILLIGVRGDIPAPPPSARPESVIDGPQREHSRKPDETYALIERMYPDLPKIELFARGAPRPGWAAWGKEVERPPPDCDLCHGKGTYGGQLQTLCGTPLVDDGGAPRMVSWPCPKCFPAEARKQGLRLDRNGNLVTRPVDDDEAP